MNKKVKIALAYLLNEEEKVTSWGISNILIKENSIHFHVEGLIYKGYIFIRCDKPYYKIIFDDGKSIQCTVAELVNVLDTNIEMTRNYIHDLKSWFLSTK